MFNIDYMNNFHFLQTYKATFLHFIKVPLTWFGLGFIFLILLNFRKYSKAERHFLGAVIIATLAAFALVILPRNPHTHYVSIIMPCILVLGIWALKNIKLAFLYYILFLLFIPYRGMQVYDEHLAYKKHTVYDKNAIEDAGNFIKKYLSEKETFSSFINDYDSLYLYSERKAYNKWSYVHYANMFWHNTLVEDFGKDLPKFVVTANIPYNWALIDLSLYHYIYINSKMTVWEKNSP